MSSPVQDTVTQPPSEAMVSVDVETGAGVVVLVDDEVGVSGCVEVVSSDGTVVVVEESSGAVSAGRWLPGGASTRSSRSSGIVTVDGIDGRSSGLRVLFDVSSTAARMGGRSVTCVWTNPTAW